MNTVLHYIYDPLCGWCYGSSPLVQAARSVSGLEIELHAGGMLAGANRQMVSAELREFILGHDQRIAARTGQPFSEAYSDGLLRDPTVLLDSEPPTAAILAAQVLKRDGLDLLARIQKAHYVEGRRVCEPATLTDLAVDIGMDRAAFAEQLVYARGTVVQEHIRQSRRLLGEAGGQGFPTFVFETPGRRELLDNSSWLGRPEEWRAELEQRVRRASH
jgi:putative protein-disulfide isomerase